METASRMCAIVLFLAGATPAFATTGTIEFRGAIVEPTIANAHHVGVPPDMDRASLRRTIEPLPTMDGGPVIEHYLGYMSELGVDAGELKLHTVAYD